MLKPQGQPWLANFYDFLKHWDLEIPQIFFCFFLPLFACLIWARSSQIINLTNKNEKKKNLKPLHFEISFALPVFLWKRESSYDMKSIQLKVYIHTYLQSRYHIGLKTTNKYSKINERIQQIKKTFFEKAIWYKMQLMRCFHN